MRNGQNGRRRGRGGVPRAPGQPGRPDMGNRSVERVRGNAHQLLEKYKQLARDASQAGDRVTAEYYLQHADHYFRTLSEFRARQEEQRPRQNGQGRDDDYDDESFDAPEPLRVAEMTPMNGGAPIPQANPDDMDDDDDDSDDGDERDTGNGQDRDGNRDDGDRRPRGRNDRGQQRQPEPVVVAEAPEPAETADTGEDRPRRRRRGRPRREDGDAASEMATVDA